MNSRIYRADFDNEIPCEHGLLEDEHNARDGIALIAIGNQLRGDDGIAFMLCNTLSATTRNKVCRFNLGLYTNFIADCFKNHKIVIILDATVSGAKLGTVHVIDLIDVINRKMSLPLKSSHGLSIMDEIHIQKLQRNLPESLVFFGIEVSGLNWSEQISLELKDQLPTLRKKLGSLIEDLLQESLLPGAVSNA